MNTTKTVARVRMAPSLAHRIRRLARDLRELGDEIQDSEGDYFAGIQVKAIEQADEALFDVLNVANAYRSDRGAGVESGQWHRGG